jgi:hypothetical protein
MRAKHPYRMAESHQQHVSYDDMRLPALLAWFGSTLLAMARVGRCCLQGIDLDGVVAGALLIVLLTPRVRMWGLGV